MLKRSHRLLMFLFFWGMISFHVHGLEHSIRKAIEKGFDSDIMVELKDPVYSDGVLKAEDGGVISVEKLRIQARKIVYTHKTEEGKPIIHVVAEGDLIVEFNTKNFVGDKIEYDFVCRQGKIYKGRLATDPWFVGGECIELLPDGNYLIHNVYLTTAEDIKGDWQLTATRAKILQERYLEVRNVQFKLGNIPVFWFPSLNYKLGALRGSPLHYSSRWGGKEGPRIGIMYELYATDTFSTYLRFIWWLKRGIGGGLDTLYVSLDKNHFFKTINYCANDISISEPDKRRRYRFQGIYKSSFNQDNTTINLTYDWLSDRDMATDYHDRGLELNTARRTELHIRHQENNWLANFLTRVRVNSFQTVKQELPTLAGSLRPFEFGRTGIISDVHMKMSYLEFEYNKLEHNLNARNYHSTRLELYQNLYRPLRCGPVCMTPQLGGLIIFYGNNPEEASKWLTLFTFNYEIATSLSRIIDENKKGVCIPYLRYEFIDRPSVPPDEHLIFDIDDGWYCVNMLRFGMRHHLLVKEENDCISRPLSLDLYSYIFFEKKKIPSTIPKINGKCVYYASPCLCYVTDVSWDLPHSLIDHSNFRIEWTLNADFALAVEYRHRSQYAWKKVDHGNFMMDMYHSVSALLQSPVSDKRDTIFLHFFYRFHPEWILEMESRHGFNRKHEPCYNEFQITLFGTILSAWHMRLSYRHKESEDRIAFNISIGDKHPKEEVCCLIPTLRF